MYLLGRRCALGAAATTTAAVTTTAATAASIRPTANVAITSTARPPLLRRPYPVRKPLGLPVAPTSPLAPLAALDVRTQQMVVGSALVLLLLVLSAAYRALCGPSHTSASAPQGGERGRRQLMRTKGIGSSAARRHRHPRCGRLMPTRCASFVVRSGRDAHALPTVDRESFQIQRYTQRAQNCHHFTHPFTIFVQSSLSLASLSLPLTSLPLSSLS